MSRRHTTTRSREESAQLQHAAEHTAPPQRRSAFIYLAALVVVAFFLLLLAYLQQQRNNAATIDSLQQSHSAVETLENLLAERDTLKEQSYALEDRIDALEGQLEAAQREQEGLKGDIQAAQSQADALNQLNLIRYYYNHNRYQDARDVITQNSGLEAALEAASRSLSAEAREVYDPLDAFRQLKSWLKLD